MLDASPDPLSTMIAASKERERDWFGPSFVFSRPVDDADSYVLQIDQCLFHRTLVLLGATELMGLLCAFDLNWADAVDPERDGFTFLRPVTFASGDVCRMCFIRNG